MKLLEDLKNQFKILARKNHPDAGDNADTMKEINCEYDALFPIWKNRHNIEEPQSQTAEIVGSTRHKFYAEWGWEDNHYNFGMSTTEISKTIRTYCKEKYPIWKLSVISEYPAGGSSISISVMETPKQVFDLESCRRAYAERLEAEKTSYHGECGPTMGIEEVLMDDNMHWQLHSISGRSKQYFAEYGFTVVEDVYKFMQSYNFDDSDSMADYFHCNFYESPNIREWNRRFRAVLRTARVKDQGIISAKKVNGKAVKSKRETPKGIEDNAEYTYKIAKGEGTHDSSELWPVRIEKTLDRETYKVEAVATKERGGRYSKFRKAFISRFDPTEILSGEKAA